VLAVFRAFRAFLTQIYYWGPRTTVVEVSADIEKGISITESQRRGTAHIHPLSVTAICGTKGTNGKFPFLGTFRKIHVAHSIHVRLG
jgi:hypothetical protein